MCGVEFEGEALVYLDPSLGVTISQIQEKIKGKNVIKNNSALILFNGIENLYLDGSLIVKNQIKDKKIENKMYVKKIEADTKDD